MDGINAWFALRMKNGQVRRVVKGKGKDLPITGHEGPEGE